MASGKDVNVTPGTPPIDPVLSSMRRDYVAESGPDVGLSEAGLAAQWPTQFGRWLREAIEAGLPEPNATVLATADPRARPSARTVLLKGYDERGFVFFTNYRSRKGAEALANPYASLVFPWFAMRRQVVVCGVVAPVDRVESEAYFAVRPRQAQLSAWASAQSSVIESRAELERDWRQMAERWPDGTAIPTPPHWGGLRLAPETVEFWQGRTGRLHDRLRYRRTGDRWLVERLAP